MPLAHIVTLSRLLLSLPCAWLVWQQHWVAAAACFAFAVGTDMVDGKLARAQGTASNFGGLLDHSTDALFVSLTLGALAMQGQISWLLPPLVLLAFGQYTLDSEALRGAKLRANWLGRTNGIAYYVLCGIGIGLPLVAAGLLQLPWRWDLLNQFLEQRQVLTLALSWFLIISTLASMANRLWSYWQLPKSEAD